MQKKAGRNDPCLCGSGKKFKKCCEGKGLRSKFQAQKIDSTTEPLIQKAKGVSSQFFSHFMGGSKTADLEKNE